MLSNYVYEMARHLVPQNDYQPKIFAIAAKLNDEDLLVRIEKQLLYLRKNKRLTKQEHALLILDAIRNSCCCGNKRILFNLLHCMFHHRNDKAWLLVYMKREIWGKKILNMIKKTCYRDCEILLRVALSDSVKSEEVGVWV